MKTSISFYRIYFHPERKLSDRQYIDDLTGAQKVAIKSLEGFFRKLPTFSERDKSLQANNSMFPIYIDRSKYQNSDEQISGILQVGENGFSSEIHDGKSGKHRLSRTPNDIEFIPFYYLLDGKAGCKDLILGIQNFGQHGIASKFLPQIRSYLKLSYPEYVIKIEPLHLGPVVFDGFITNGSVKEIEAVSFVGKTDKASKKEDGMKVVMQYGATRRGGLLPPAITNLVRKNAKIILKGSSDENAHSNFVNEVKNILSIKLPEGGEIAELSATMMLNGVTRKIDLGDIYKFATRYDVTEDVNMGKDGHPIFSSIDTVSKEILEKDIRSLIKN